MPEKDLSGLWASLGESLDKIFKEMYKWMELQMSQNRLMKLEILNLKDRVNKLEGIIEKDRELANVDDTPIGGFHDD